MIEKRFSGKITEIVKTGSLEEDQVKEIHQLEVLFPEGPEVIREESQEPKKEPEEEKE